VSVVEEGTEVYIFPFGKMHCVGLSQRGHIAPLPGNVLQHPTTPPRAVHHTFKAYSAWSDGARSASIANKLSTLTNHFNPL
jgi:hypothetical protein